MKINNKTNYSFKAQLLTKPEQFYSPSDSEDDKKYISAVFAIANRVLNAPNVDKFTKNDTVEFVRNRYKKGFAYTMVYKTPDIKGDDINKKIFENIKFKAPDMKFVFNMKTIFYQLTGIVAYKRGLIRELPLFTPYKELRDKTFELTKEQSEKFPF